MITLIHLFLIYLACAVVYSITARYTIYKNNEYIKTVAIVKEGFIDFGKFFVVITVILGILIGINYLKFIL